MTKNTKDSFPILSTTLHTYCYNLDNPNEAIVYKALKASLKQTHPRRMKSFGNHYHDNKDLNGSVVFLSTKHLFDNQWNEEHNNKRLFDWAEDYLDSSNIRRGYYLDQTSEMREIRNTTYRCGYCGKLYRPRPNFPAFCSTCSKSPYLKPENFPMLRLRPVSKSFLSHPPLTDEERNFLLSHYIDNQLFSPTQEKTLARYRTDTKNRLQSIKAILAGLDFLEQRNINSELYIIHHYSSNKPSEFCFGWRSPLAPELVTQLELILQDFPAPYTIKRG